MTMMILYDNQAKWKQHGGSNGNELPPGEEEAVATRATARGRGRLCHG